MSGLDILIVIMLGIGLWQGYQQGLMRALFNLVGWLIALFVANNLAKPLAPLFAGWSSSALGQVIWAFLAVVLAVIVLLHGLLWLYTRLMKSLHLSVVDRLAGACFGLGKNLLVVLLCLSVIAPFSQQQAFWQTSRFAQRLLPFAPFAARFTKQLSHQALQRAMHPTP